MRKFDLFRVSLFCLICTAGGMRALGQQATNKSYTKELSVTVDNDYFVFKGTDRYYTNGLFLQYSQLLPNKNTKTDKKVLRFEVGQTIFKQFTRKVWPTVLVSNMYPGGVGAIDRPITGYLFGKVQKSIFSKKDRLVQWGVSVGTIGPNSLARKVQTNWHKTAGVGNWWDWVWDYELNNEVGVNLHGKYALPLLKNNASSLWNIASVSEATLGTSFTDISQSVVFQFGKFQKMSESSYWGSRLYGDAASDKTELFFYYAPELKYQIYNATIQGGMFREDKGPITSTPQPFVFTNALGMLYGRSRYTASMAVHFLTKSAETQRNNHAYGKIQLAYRFR